MKASKTKPAQNVEFSHIRENLLKVQFDQTPVYLTEETAWEMMYEMAAFLDSFDHHDQEQVVSALRPGSMNIQRKYYS